MSLFSGAFSPRLYFFNICLSNLVQIESCTFLLIGEKHSIQGGIGAGRKKATPMIAQYQWNCMSLSGWGTELHGIATHFWSELLLIAECHVWGISTVRSHSLTNTFNGGTFLLYNESEVSILKGLDKHKLKLHDFWCWWIVFTFACWTKKTSNRITKIHWNHMAPCLSLHLAGGSTCQA